MAERRMFTKKVTDDDNFMQLSSSAQALYLHLTMSADDDGFNNQVTLSMFKAHASVQDLQALIDHRYIIQFENGVIVIKHWRMANALRKDRYTPTSFTELMERLDIKDNASYTLATETRLPDGCRVVAERLPDGCRVVATGKDSIGKDSIGKDNKGSSDPLSALDPSVKAAFLSFQQMRKTIKKPMTAQAVDRMAKKLQKMSTDPDTQVRILQQSEDHCWSDIYPLKEEERKQANTNMMTHGEQMRRDIAALVEEAERR